MPIYDSSSLSHTVTSYTLGTSRDAGGGTVSAYTAADSSVKCIINTASASTVELYAQQNIRVSHTVSFLGSVLTTALVRGMKLVDSGGRNFHIEGIRTGRAMGNVPAFTYADCSELL